MGFTSDACWLLLIKNNKKRQAALKSEAGEDEKHVFFIFTWPNSTWQGNSKLSIRIAQIVRSNHITPSECEFRRQILECKAVYGLTDHLSL